VKQRFVSRTIALAMFAFVIGGASSSRADTIMYQLGLGNTAVSPYTGPYVDVLVDLTSATTAEITFTSLSNGSETFLLGDGGAVAINVNALGWTVGSFSSSNAGTGFTPGPLTDDGSKNVDSFGLFNQVIKDFDGYSHTADEISLVLTNTSGSWLSAADVLLENANGYVAAAHVFIADCATSVSCDAGTPALTTGFVTVPEPSTALMLALGFVGLAARRRARG
jgi:hypothetical protein